MTKRLHLQRIWYGVTMGFSECGTPVAPFAANVTRDRKKVTCRRCWLKAARRKRVPARTGQEGKANE